MDPGTLTWLPREDPPAPTAVAAPPGAVPLLLAALEDRLRDGTALRLVHGPSGALVLGPADQLPWFPGAVYLAPEAGVLVPTAVAPRPAADLVVRILGDRLPADCDLVAVVPWGVLVAPTPRRPVDDAALAALRAASDTPAEQP